MHASLRASYVSARVCVCICIRAHVPWGGGVPAHAWVSATLSASRRKQSQSQSHVQSPTHVHVLLPHRIRTPLRFAVAFTLPIPFRSHSRSRITMCIRTYAFTTVRRCAGLGNTRMHTHTYRHQYRHQYPSHQYPRHSHAQSRAQIHIPYRHTPAHRRAHPTSGRLHDTALGTERCAHACSCARTCTRTGACALHACIHAYMHICIHAYMITCMSCLDMHGHACVCAPPSMHLSLSSRALGQAASMNVGIW